MNLTHLMVVYALNKYGGIRTATVPRGELGGPGAFSALAILAFLSPPFIFFLPVCLRRLFWSWMDLSLDAAANLPL